MQYIMQNNLYLIYFVYGLSFFIAGFIILFQYFKLINRVTHVQYLGLFFLLHGIADWGPLFYPIQSRIYSTQTMNIFKGLHIIVVVLSFYFLAVYGVNLLARYLKRFKGVTIQIPNIVIILLIVISVFILKTNGFHYWHDTIDTLARYFLGFPAAILSGFALINEREFIQDFYEPRVGKYLKITYFTFFVYAFISGIIVEAGDFFPANVINTKNFFLYTGFPIQFFRALCGVVIAFCIITILDIFYVELVKKLEEVEKEAIIYEERERISQDIHDGTMQALYGVGLRLQYVDAMLKNYEDEAVKEHLRYALQKLNQTSKEIRSYITNLRPQYENKELASEIKNIVKDFISETNIQVRYDYDQNKNYEINETIIQQISFILKEALNNVRKHADATVVQLGVMLYEDKIEIMVRDNGKGFESDTEECITKDGGIGLKSISKRVNDLHGSLNICSHRGAGTGISIIIPLEGSNG